MADLITPATPFFFATMGAEHLYQQRQRAQGRAPAAGDYERRDTIASLTMGTASLFAPIVLRRALRPVTPGRGRWGRALVLGAVGAAVATTAADVVSRAASGRLAEAGVVPAAAADRGAGDVDSEAAGGPRRLRRLARRARKVASATGTTAVAAGVTAGCLSWITATTGERLWRRWGQRRDLGRGVAVTAGAILAWDLIYYLNHRLSHESRLMWAMHVVHHSSERYNLSTALRQPVADTFTLSVPYSLMCLAGVHPSVLETARGVNLLYQYWIHTETIPKLGPLEEVLNTPSHHRVHHGSNRRYLDRNHGSILIVWDRLFGTFQRELDEEPVVYGLTKNIDTFNPLRIATHEHADILRDVAASDTWSDRLGFTFRGPGWAYERHASDPSLPEPTASEAPHAEVAVAAGA